MLAIRKSKKNSLALTDVCMNLACADGQKNSHLDFLREFHNCPCADTNLLEGLAFTDHIQHMCLTQCLTASLPTGYIIGEKVFNNDSMVNT